jgi:pimeloyl-ACP methyl ester carboxylesterase
MSKLRRGSYDGLVTVAGVRIRLRVAGAGSGAPVLLLNGLTRPLESWQAFTQGISGRTLISFDAPGVGRSPRTLLPMSIPRLARLAAAVLDELGHETVDVVGFSHGGAVAQQFAFDAPTRVRRLVLVSTSCGFGATPPGWRVPPLERLLVLAEPLLWPRPDTLGTLYHAFAFMTWSSIPFLGAIHMPTLVVTGDMDRVVPPVNSRVLANRIAGAHLVTLPGGHDVQRPRPAQALAQAVACFLDGESAGYSNEGPRPSVERSTSRLSSELITEGNCKGT